MFENLGHFFKKIVKEPQKELGSKDAAKERLHLVLMQDRANVSADFLELMKQEIIDVIKKYIVVDEDSIDVRLTNQTKEDGTNGAPSLYANIPIVNIKNDMMAEKIKDFEGVDFNKEMGIPTYAESYKIEENVVETPEENKEKIPQVIELPEKNSIEEILPENNDTNEETENNTKDEDEQEVVEEMFEEVDDAEEDDDDVTFDDLLKAAEAAEKMAEEQLVKEDNKQEENNQEEENKEEEDIEQEDSKDIENSEQEENEIADDSEQDEIKDNSKSGRKKGNYKKNTTNKRKKKK